MWGSSTTILLVLLLLLRNACNDALRRTASSGRRFFATTVQGLEHVLAKEVSQLTSVQDVKTQKCGVSFSGDDMTVLEGLMHLRTPLKLMETVVEGRDVTTKEDLYDLCASYDWAKLLDQRTTLKCDAVLGSVPQSLCHTHFCALTVKNAITDQFMDRYGSRPSVDIEDPDLPLLMYLHKGKATVYKVWSGDRSMHKRGYRQTVHKAALRETTAASL
jgi:23S rRNA G2445 N2-methylase RlmL